MHELFANFMSLSTTDAVRMVQAMTYVMEVRTRRRFKVLTEVTEQADWLPSNPPTTADLVLYLSDELHVLDLKTGKIEVDVIDNDQMLFYAATYAKYAPRATEVHLHIVQPWADNVAEWVVSMQDLSNWIDETVSHDLQIMDGDVAFSPGDHCQFCPANPHTRGARGNPLCPVMLEMLYPSPPISVDDIMKLAEGEQ